MFQTDLLWQNDSRWANYPLGSGPHTIKEWGCLMVDLCMVVNGFGYSENPRSFNDKMMSEGGFQGEMISAWVLPQVYPRVQTLSYDECASSPAPIAKIDAALAKGDPVILQVDWSPNTGVQSHWVIAYAREDDDYLIYDPYKYSGDVPGKKLGLLTRYNHQGNTLSKAISAALFMTGSKASAEAGDTSGGTLAKPAPKATPPADSILVYPSADGLALRTSDSIGAAMLRRLDENAALKSLESKANTQAKLGQYGQWLHVEDLDGQQGYTAAWYLRKNEPASGPLSAGVGISSATSAATGKLIVTPTTEGLAFRDGPDTTANLIKRLPFTARLESQEPNDSARGKLGVSNQWLRVKDVTGAVGYAAAWYLTEAAAPVLGVKVLSEDDESGQPDRRDEVIVRTTTQGLAFRKMPVVSASTLIKRLALQSELALVEAGDQDKIGEVGAWLRVRDVSGQEGWVAAWYVTE
jgi:hypothetical protein